MRTLVIRNFLKRLFPIDIIQFSNNNHINFYPLHKLKRVLDEKTIEFENGIKTSYDVLAVIPPHRVPKIIMDSNLLGDRDQHWIYVDRFTLKTKYKNVFAIGDVTAIPKAGIFAEGEMSANYR